MFSVDDGACGSGGKLVDCSATLVVEALLPASESITGFVGASFEAVESCTLSTLGTLSVTAADVDALVGTKPSNTEVDPRDCAVAVSVF
jgi:hypothetical protein